ncbi:MAG TPA: twin-arginine translocase TatA/TatE family subunit [Candidatus Xenobia bacterium]|jgi:TatA/E family protein of Tat protein translocase
MLSGPDTVVLLVVALLVFGPKKLPEMGKSLGRTIHDLRDAMEGRLPPDDNQETAVRRVDAPRRDEEGVIRRAQTPPQGTEATAALPTQPPLPPEPPKAG